MENLLAKSSGITLLDHSKNVSKIATKLAKILYPEIEPKILKVIETAGYLHDIGKCDSNFQKKLSKKPHDEEFEIKLKHLHNEIGWSFLSQSLKMDSDMLDLIIDPVYWHHGISSKTKYNKQTNTEIKISAADKKVMINFVKEMLGDQYITEKEYNPKPAPKYYVDNNVDNCDYINMIKTFIRGCIIPADRLVSEYEKDNKNVDDISFDVSRTGSIDLSKHPYFGNSRWQKQEEISSQVHDTTIVNAPAGFGKTLLGLINNLSGNKKLIWVCPRNVISDSVYDAILREINCCEGHTISMELYLSGDVIKHNEFFQSEFSSDIIVTNIDNFLYPSVDNRYAGRLWTILQSDVVFDEFHELIGEKGLFACFINLMNVKHKLTNNKTLLLSATSDNLHQLWDSFKKTIILPKNNQHYPAQHEKNIKINILDSFVIAEPKENNLIFLNSIANAQRLYNELGAEILAHSQFLPEKRQEIIKKIYDEYGKSVPKTFDRPNTVSTNILQASLDISYAHIYESILSPRDTLQRGGRCNRFGDYNHADGKCTTYNIINYVNSSERSIRNVLYQESLTKMWFNYISKYNQQIITQDKFYQIYNEYNRINQKILYQYLKDVYYQSLTELSKRAYPIKSYSHRKSDILNAGSNRLRSSGNEVFFICKQYNTNKYTDPISVSLYNGFGEDFKEKGDMCKRLIPTMRKIKNSGDERFNYEPLLKKRGLNLDIIRKSAKISNTPYIRYDVVYHPEYGIIENDLINKLLNK